MGSKKPSPSGKTLPGRGEMPRKRQRGGRVLNEVKRMRGMSQLLSFPKSEYGR